MAKPRFLIGMFLSELPKIEKVTRDLSISHFFLMFGYKLFSLYFPLFLMSKGMSLPEVGYTYLLIYLPIAFSAPFVGFLNHKINPGILASLGILGYGLYSLGMVLIVNPVLFYLWQVLLGVSAALFFISGRAILMGSTLESYDRAFGWFYSAPFYAEAIAPAIGAVFIWKFNFVGVLILSLFLHFVNAIFCFIRLKTPGQVLPDYGFRFRNFQENYQKTFQKLKSRRLLYSILISFSVLLLSGFYHAFFVLFLKTDLRWSQNLILIFVSVLSFLILPISLWIINRVGKQESKRSIFEGSLITGIFSILFGLLLPFLNFPLILIMMLGKSVGSLMASSGRSGLISKILKKIPEEGAAIDTIFSPLGVALGALISGLLLDFLGYKLLFILGGVFVLLVGLLLKD